MREIGVKDIWKFKEGAAVYGYCVCGREVRYLKDYKCPCCGIKLKWNIPEHMKMCKENY